MESIDSPVKNKMKPSYYTARSFHGIRAISAISSIIVTSILIFFVIQLKSDNYKVPWTFLIILLTTVLTLLCLVLTSFVQCCFRLSPIFNLVLNVPLLILWIVSVALLGWNIIGTLSHSCSISNWGNDDGVMVCQQYKAMFAFVIFGVLAQIGAIVVDVRARVAQNRSGTYAKMRDSTSDVKLEPYSLTHSQQSSVHNLPYQETSNQYRDQDEPGWRPGQRTNTYASSNYSEHGDIGGRDGRDQVMMNQFNNNYHAPAQGTGYDSHYGQQGNFGHRYQ